MNTYTIRPEGSFAFLSQLHISYLYIYLDREPQVSSFLIASSDYPTELQLLLSQQWRSRNGQLTRGYPSYAQWPYELHSVQEIAYVSA